MNIKISCLMLLLFINNLNILGCKINMDSLFCYHTHSIDSYLKSIINGEILPSVTKYRINADITGKQAKTNYTDSSKFEIIGRDYVFLEIYEYISSYPFERHEYNPTILINRKEIKMVQDWYNNNKDKLNYNKIEQIAYWKFIKLDFYSKGYLMKDSEHFDTLYQSKMDSLKKLKTFINVSSI